MQIKGLVKTLDEMTDEELLSRLQTVRHSREVARPVAKRKAAKAETKASRARMGKVDKLLAGLSESERESLLKQLEDGDEQT
ncbi:MAG: hypothetical protein ACYDB1_00725 [Acidiferrobacteraceae bacterium]